MQTDAALESPSYQVLSAHKQEEPYLRTFSFHQTKA